MVALRRVGFLVTLPHVLPTPPLRQQEPRRCWSAAFDSWNVAMANWLNLSPPGLTETDLHRWFSPDTGLSTKQGRLTQSGVRTLAGVGWMHIEEWPGQNLTLERADRMLNGGYVYCAYYSATAGHACVLYGVRESGFLVMDPSAGYLELRPNFFQEFALRVGVSLLAQISASIDTSVDRLRPAPGGGPAYPL